MDVEEMDVAPVAAQHNGHTDVEVDAPAEDQYIDGGADSADALAPLSGAEQAANGGGASSGNTPTGLQVGSGETAAQVEEEEEEEEIDEQSLLDEIDGNKKGGKNKARNQKKKEKQKQKKLATANGSTGAPPRAASTPSPASASSSLPLSAIIEYVDPTLDNIEDPELAAIFKHFMPDSAGADSDSKAEGADGAKTDDAEAAADGEEDGAGSVGSAEGGGAGDGPKISKKQRKKLLSDFVAALKREVQHPEVVEAHDASSSDPKLLVALKSYRNAVPVPRHWCHKRKYLQGKLGLQKPPFQLPDFITNTGITKLRSTDLDTQDAKTLKAKTRERVAPKMGRIEIDYQVLHDAFFKYQTKPKLSAYGDVYYEGKEYEKSHDHHKPGTLSERLRVALALPTEGPVPTPWLINQQRYGPPPSYPNLRIPGLNAPIPAGHRFGFGPMEWGRPPVDQFGTPLYGDVFGFVSSAESAESGDNFGNGFDPSKAKGNQKHWGEFYSDALPDAAAVARAQIDALEADSLEQPAEPVSAADEAALAEAAAVAAGAATPAGGAESVSAFTVSTGLETPETLELRKGARKGIETPSGLAPPPPPAGGAAAAEAPKALYQVLDQKQTGLAGGLLGTKHGYVVPAKGAGASSAESGVAIALNPEDLSNLDEHEIAKKYEEAAARAAAEARSSHEAAGGIASEELQSLLEEQERKRKRKEGKGGDKDDREGGSKKKKTGKDFKF